MVMDIWRKWKTCENKDEFADKRNAHNVRSSAVRTDEFVAVVKETLDNDRSQSYIKIAADIGCHKPKICRKIKEDIGYSTYCKSHRMFITNASKESRKRSSRKARSPRTAWRLPARNPIVPVRDRRRQYVAVVYDAVSYVAFVSGHDEKLKVRGLRGDTLGAIRLSSCAKAFLGGCQSSTRPSVDAATWAV
ncbi:unnamed protein product [Acanthosepion pharaonis]|uniref:Transposase n=1 Tax=Acanthosepion pharaonis TaxID=158019 RepID=A0A812EVP5_ACAPH|nr:unnamed protein product [Sepia pharaonis]